MNAVANAERYDWQTWLVGILRSAVSGGAGAVGGGVGSMGIDPEHFNLKGGLGHTLELMGACFALSAIIHMAMFLQTHGAPDLVTVKTTDTTVTQVGQTTKVSEVETTSTVPKP